MNLKDTKVWIGKNPRLSRILQLALKRQGYGWSNGKLIQNTNRLALYIYSEGTLCFSSSDSQDKSRFSEHHFKEVQPHHIIDDSTFNEISRLLK